MIMMVMMMIMIIIIIIIIIIMFIHESVRLTGQKSIKKITKILHNTFYK